MANGPTELLNEGDSSMNLDAPPLANIDHAISNDGEVCQITLKNQALESLAFRMTFRQLSHFITPLREVAKEMQKRLMANKETAKAGMLAALAEAAPAEAVSVAVDKNTGDQIVSFEGNGLGLLTVRLPPAVAQALLLSLKAPGGETKH